MLFKVANHDLNSMPTKEVTEFMYVQWNKDKASGKLAGMEENKQGTYQYQVSHGN